MDGLTEFNLGLHFLELRVDVLHDMDLVNVLLHSLWVPADGKSLALKPLKHLSDPLLHDVWQELLQLVLALLGSWREGLANRSGVHLEHAHVFALWQEVVVAISLRFESLQQGFNDLGRIFEFFFSQYLELDLLVLPLFKQEWLVGFKDFVNLLEGITHELFDQSL